MIYNVPKIYQISRTIKEMIRFPQTSANQNYDNSMIFMEIDQLISL